MGLLFAAVTKLVGSGSQKPIPLIKWRHDAEKWSLANGPLGNWLDFVEKSLTAESSELAEVLKNGSATTEARLVVALLLSVSDSVSVEDRFYANLGLVTTNFYESWQKETEEIIATIVSNGWLEVAQNQRFALRAPAITAEAIIAACQDTYSHGFRKAARVLLTVKDAVWLPMSEDVISSLKEKAAGSHT